MAIETAYSIWELDERNPDPDDDIGEAEDHIGLIKGCLKRTFSRFDATTHEITPIPPNNYVHISSEELNAFDSVYKTVDNVSGVPIGASIEGTIKASGYSTEFKNMVFKFDPIESTKLKLAQPTVPIGSIIASMLSQTQMDTLHGTIPGTTPAVGNFLLCDGRAIPTSALLRKTYSNITVTPELRERIISQADVDVNVNVSHEPLTKWTPIDDFTLPIIDPVTNYSHNHENYFHTHDIPLVWQGFTTGTYAYTNSKTVSGTPTKYYTDMGWATAGGQAIDYHGHLIAPEIGANLPGKNFPNRAVINYYMRVN